MLYKEYFIMIENEHEHVEAKKFVRVTLPQQVEAVFNRISGSRNKNYSGLINTLQGFQKCIA